MNINQTLRLSSNQYYRDVLNKKNIYLHHTVGGSAKSTFDYWNSNQEHVATAYIVDRDGTIYEVFDPHYWAHHLGLKILANTYYNKTSIGIELASEGALRSGKELNSANTQHGFQANFSEDWLYAFDIYVPPFQKAKKLYNMTNDKTKYLELDWKGYKYFDRYDEPQVVATIELILYLCDEFKIPKLLLPENQRFEFNIKTADFSGILTHCNVRIDKTDLCPDWSWNRLATAMK